VRFLIFLFLFGCTHSIHDEQKGVLRQFLNAPVSTLDPIKVKDEISRSQIVLTYQTLLKFKKTDTNYILVPELLQALPSVEQTKGTARFELKKGILFHDDPCFKETNGRGRELTIDDVIYMFERVKQSDKNLQNVIIKNIKELKKINRYEFLVQLLPEADLNFNWLADPRFSIVPKEAVDFYQGDFEKHPVGTGSFRLNFKNSKMNSNMQWDVYPPTTHLDRLQGVQYLVEDSSQKQVKAFLNQEVDVIELPFNQNESEWLTPSKELVLSKKKLGMVLTKKPFLDVTYEAFNLESPIFKDNVKLRQALSLAFDSGLVVKHFYGGRAIEASSLMPYMGGDFISNPYAVFDLSKAKKFLAEAGYPNGEGLPEINYAYYKNSDYLLYDGLTYPEFIKKSFSQIGVKVKLSDYNWNDYIKIVEQKKADMWNTVWVANLPNEEVFFEMYYHSNQKNFQSETGFNSPEYNELFEKINSIDKVKLNKLNHYNKMLKILYESVPSIWIAHRLQYKIYLPRVKNVLDFDEYDSSWMQTVYIDPDKKREEDK